MIHLSVQNKLPEIIQTLKEHKVKRAYAFGSVCTNEFNSESDIDLLIAFDVDEPFDGYAENLWKLEEELHSITKRKVELIPVHTLRNPYFIMEVEKTKTALYE